MVSHELRNPLSAIVQSSDVVLNSLRGMFSEPTISAAMSHEVSDDIETMKSIGLCTMHMRRLIDDTINVQNTLNSIDNRSLNLKVGCFK
jgi:signal transduction histidine kinase